MIPLIAQGFAKPLGADLPPVRRRLRGRHGSSDTARGPATATKKRHPDETANRSQVQDARGRSERSRPLSPPSRPDHTPPRIGEESHGRRFGIRADASDRPDTMVGRCSESAAGLLGGAAVAAGRLRPRPATRAGRTAGGRWVRVAQLDRPAITVDLVEEEAAGGHTIARHVGKSDEWLMVRVRPVTTGLFVSPGVRRAGSFSSLRSANHWTNETLARNFGTVAEVAAGRRSGAFVTSTYTARTGREAFQPTRLAMWNFERPTGPAYIRQTFGVDVAILHDPSSPKGFRVHTSYPGQD